MYPGTFEYLTADSIAEALDLLAEHPDAALLAGGHSLLPAITNGQADPEVVIDISEIDAVRGVEVVNGVAKIGAVSTYAELEADHELRAGATALAEAATAVGDAQVRNRGTIGGNLAHPVRVSDLSAAIIASDATILVEGPHDGRSISADEFFAPTGDTDLTADELITTIEVPLATEAAGGAYEKKQSDTARYTLLGVAVSLRVDGGRVSSARVAANGVTDRGVKLGPVEEALEGERLVGSTIETAARKAMSDIDEAEMIDDEQASAAYRAHLLPTYTERAIERAAERAGIDVPA